MAITGSIQTTVTGLQGWATRIAKAQQLQAITARYANLIAETARGLAPVDTGGLAASIKVVLGSYTAKIQAGEGLPDARAIYQEIGFHHYISGAFIQNAYLRPAVERHIDAWKAEIMAAMR
jgi:hypothetical protein